MPAILEDVKNAAASLTPAEQVELLDYLEEISLSEMASIREEWIVESRRRFAEMESGQVKGVPVEEVFSHRKRK